VRKFFPYILIFFVLELSCKSSEDTSVSIKWSDDLILPAIGKDSVNPGLAGAFSGIYGNYMIIAGGANFPGKLPWDGGKKVYHPDAYLFHNENNVWNFVKTFPLKDTLGYGASVSLGEGVVCLGGENENGITDRSFLLKYDSISKQLISTPFVPLPIPLTNLSAIALGEKIYIAGGATVDSVSNKMFVLDYRETNRKWKELASLPRRLTNFVMTNLGNEIYVIGGRCLQGNGISSLYSSVYAYDIRSNSWKEKHPLPYSLSAGTGIGLNEEQILLFGGDRGETFHKTELLLQQIGREKDSTKKAALINEKNILQKNHPGFSPVILEYDKEKDSWRQAGEIPFPSPATTIAIRYKDEIIIPSGEVRAGVRTPHILTGKIKQE